MDKEEIMAIEQRKNTIMLSLLDEILSNYVPATGEADYEPTSVELATAIKDTIGISPNALAIALVKRGFHTKLRGSQFLWQMDFANKE